MMRKFLFAVLLFLLAPFTLWANNTTPVTATITDPDGFVWANGTFQAALVNQRGGNVFQNNAVVPPPNLLVSGSLSNTGVLNATLLDTSSITPGGILWVFTICPNASAKACAVMAPISVTGVGTLNLTSTFAPQIQALRFPALPGAYGYGDVEITPLPPPGGFYYNVTSLVQRVWNGTIWVPNTGGGGATAPATHNFFGGDNAGNIININNTQTTIDGSGKYNITCMEDRNKGEYDPRCPAYAGGVFGATPWLALQAVENQVACDIGEGKVSGAAVVKLPQGSFPANDLELAPGSTLTGQGNSVGGTQIFERYNGHRLMYMPISMNVAVCPDGATNVNYSTTDGLVQNISIYGCGQGTCVNAPGDVTAYPANGGPLDLGLEMGQTGGVVQYLYAHNFGGTGFRLDGQDSRAFHIRSYFNNAYYYFQGGTYNPATDTSGPMNQSFHGDVELVGLDMFVDDVETYGTFMPTLGVEYGHIAGILTGGGDSEFDHLWPQVNEVGIMQPYGFGANNRFAHFRVDFSQGEGIVVNDVDLQFDHGLVDASCSATNSATIAITGGHCVQIAAGGLSPIFTNVQTADNGGFGPTFKTGDWGPAINGKFIAITGTFDTTYTTIPYGQGVEKDYTSSPAGVAGPNPDVQNIYNSLFPIDSTPTTWTYIKNLMAAQDLWIQSGVNGGNTTLESVSNGGYFATCTGNNLVLSFTGWTHWKVSNPALFGAPATLTEQCDANGVPGGGITALTGDTTATGTGSVASVTHAVNGVAFSGLATGILKNTTGTGVPSIAVKGTDYRSATNHFDVDNYPTSCTVAAVNYTTQLDCAFYTLKNAGSSGIIELGSNTFGSPYTTCAGLVEPTTAGQISIIGQQSADNVVPGSEIKATCAMQAIISHPDVVNGGNIPYSFTLGNVNLDANNFAQQCAAIYAEKVDSIYNVHCRNAVKTATLAPFEVGDINAPGGFQGFGYQQYVSDIYVTGQGNGQGSWAVLTATQTAGIPSIGVTSGGTYLNAAPPVYLIGHGAGANPCTVMPSAITANMTAGAVTSVTVTGGSGCSGTMFAWSPDIGTAPYAFVGSSTDSHFTNIVTQGVGNLAQIYYPHGSNTMIHDHPISSSPVLIKDIAANTHYGAEADSPFAIGIESDHKYASWYGTEFTTSGGVPITGADGFFTTTQIQAYGVNCGGASTNSSGFNLLVYSATGPVAHGTGITYGASTVYGGMQCDNLSVVNASPNMAIAGNLAANSLNINQDSAVAAVGLHGTGANASVCDGWAAGRAFFCFSLTPGTAVVQGKSGVDILTGLTILTGKVAGWGASGIAQEAVGTSFASAATIVPTAEIYHITAAGTNIANITAPTGCTTVGISCRVVFLPDAASITFVTGGNIAAGLVATINVPVVGWYDPNTVKWYLK